MNSEDSEINALLERIADNQLHVLDLGVEQQRGECALRRQLRQRAKRYIVAVGSRLEQEKRHRDEPAIDWRYLDFNNALSYRHLSQPGFDVVLLPSAPDDLAPWQPLLRHGGWLIAGSAGRWQSWPRLSSRAVALEIPPPALENLREAGNRAAERLPEPTRLASLAAFQAESESLAPLMMLHILQQLNFILPEGWRIETRIQQLRIAPCFNRLLTRWHHSLEEQGFLEQLQGEWRSGECAPTELALEQRLDDGKHRLRQFLHWLDNGPLFADGLFASSSAIETVLKEPQLASSLLFPEGGRAAEALSQGNIIADYLGSVVARLLETAIGENTTAQVMEIGAGTGSLTASTLPAFTALAVEGTYLHTDVTPWFTHYAEQRFGDDDRLRTGRYDINQSAAAQGYKPGSMDAILAANVLHNAHRLEETLGDIYQLLKPGACLLLLAATQDKELQWVTAATVLEHAAERGESQCDSRLLSETQWREMLTAAGFVLIDVWPHAGTPMAFTGQRVFLACRPQPAISPDQLQRAILPTTQG